ncbi:MAG: hypothetical protein JWM98_1811 [Thermoleophilia bacterium]|nr:hypothetical protein [Thermoleophilia bacterium]
MRHEDCVDACHRCCAVVAERTARIVELEDELRRVRGGAAWAALRIRAAGDAAVSAAGELEDGLRPGFAG